MLEDVIDFEVLQDPRAPRLFISATDLKRGRAVVFGNAEMCVEVLLASVASTPPASSGRIGTSSAS